MTTALVSVMDMQREAARLAAVAQQLEHKLEAVKNRPDALAEDFGDTMTRHIYDAQSSALDALSLANRMLMLGDKEASRG